jgi:hypothetical protein
MTIRINSDIPFISLDDVFTSTTREFSEVPTTANGATKNNHNHITSESLVFGGGFYILFIHQVFIEYLTRYAPLLGVQ